jgi:hypothetical protein
MTGHHAVCPARLLASVPAAGRVVFRHVPA